MSILLQILIVVLLVAVVYALIVHNPGEVEAFFNLFPDFMNPMKKGKNGEHHDPHHH